VTAPTWLRFMTLAPGDAEELDRLTVVIAALIESVRDVTLSEPGYWPEHRRFFENQAKRCKKAVTALNALLPHDVHFETAVQVRAMVTTLTKHLGEIEKKVVFCMAIPQAPKTGGRYPSTGKLDCLKLCQEFFQAHGKHYSQRSLAGFARLVWNEAHGNDRVTLKAWEKLISRATTPDGTKEHS